MFVRDAKALCPHLVIFPYNFEAYEEVSYISVCVIDYLQRRIKNTISYLFVTFSPLIIDFLQRHNGPFAGS
jgi:hypothetical protein